MATSFYQLPSDSGNTSGKKLLTETMTIGPDTGHMHRYIISDKTVDQTAGVVAKGSQAPYALATQDQKDAGRVNICWTISGTQSTATAEALATVTESRDGGTTTTFTTKVVTSGKRLRLDSITAVVELVTNTTATALNRTRVRVRFNTGGAVTTSSQLQYVFALPSVTGNAKTVSPPLCQQFPSGAEWLGDGTRQIGITLEHPDWVTAAAVVAYWITIQAFEY